MDIVQFPFFHGLPTVLVTLEAARPRAQGTRRLLVDSGFTGNSAFVLSTEDVQRFRRRAAPSSHVSGALSGTFERGWVKCSMSELDFSRHLMAISSDLSSLALPTGIDGLAGLAFLNLFSRWSAERSASNDWTFVLQMRD